MEYLGTGGVKKNKNKENKQGEQKQKIPLLWWGNEESHSPVKAAIATDSHTLPFTNTTYQQRSACVRLGLPASLGCSRTAVRPDQRQITLASEFIHWC